MCGYVRYLVLDGVESQPPTSLESTCSNIVNGSDGNHKAIPARHTNKHCTQWLHPTE